MTTPDLPESYLAGLSLLLPEASVAGLGAQAAPDRFDLTQFEEAGSFLIKSQNLRSELHRRWRDAGDPHERSKREIQLLGAAAADLVIADRLVASVPGLMPQASGRERGPGIDVETALIFQALNQPELLLTPAISKRWRGAERGQLLESTYQSLDAIRNQTIRASQAAIVDLLAMNLAIVKQAVELLGEDIASKLRTTAFDVAALAIEYVITASGKLHDLLGPDAETLLKEAALRFLDDLRYGQALGKVVDKFLQTGVIYEEAKGWIGGYSGEATLLAGTAERVAALQGSFSGREKLALTVLRAMAVIKLLTPMQTPPWGPLATGACYLSILAYILYSAHDHVDSDRYAFFDRVQGVRGLLLAELDPAIQPPPGTGPAGPQAPAPPS